MSKVDVKMLEVVSGKFCSLTFGDWFVWDGKLLMKLAKCSIHRIEMNCISAQGTEYLLGHDADVRKVDLEIKVLL